MAKYESDFDFERAALLLNIMKQVADIGPMWSAISAEAGDELKSMHEELVANRKARAEAERDRNVVPGQPVDSGNPQPAPTRADGESEADYNKRVAVWNKNRVDAMARRDGRDPQRPDPNQRIYPEGSGVREERDPPPVQRRVNP